MVPSPRMMLASPRTEAELLGLVDSFFRAYEKGDVDAIMGLLAKDPNLLLIGTESEERCVGPDEVRALFERDVTEAESMSVDMGWHQVCASGPVAWVAAEINVRVIDKGEELVTPVLFSAVFEQRLQRWMIVQIHLSIPAGL